MNQKIRDIVLYSIILILTVFFAFVLNRAYEILGLKQLCYGLIILSFLILGNAAILGVLLKSKMSERMNAQLAVIQQFVEPRKFQWLKPLCEVDAIERTTMGSEIWVVSPDLSNDTGNAPIIPAVKNNAERGILYTYVLPENDLIIARIGELKEVFKQNPDKLKLCLLSPKEFNLLSSTHLVIYNPRGEEAKPAQVFLELPIEDRIWWVEMSREHASNFVGKLTSVIDKTQ